MVSNGKFFWTNIMEQDEAVSASSVLVVDDNPRNLQVVGGILQNEGYKVEFALDGTAALGWLEKMDFDLILLDVMMPGLDGFEVCSRIRTGKNKREIPIIFITANTDSGSIVRAFEKGAVDYITKPFIRSELIARVRAQLSIKRSNDQVLQYLNEIEEKNKNINDSIKYASYIQNAVIGTSTHNLKILPEHFLINMPKDVLSGDFYWMSRVGNKLIIAAMDCTGHGVPGALMSIMGNTLLNEIILCDQILQPHRILNSLRSKIISALGSRPGSNNIKDGIEGSVVCIDAGSDRLQFSGSFNPLIIVNGKRITEIKADRMPIGYSDISRDFSLHGIKIDKGSYDLYVLGWNTGGSVWRPGQEALHA